MHQIGAGVTGQAGDGLNLLGFIGHAQRIEWVDQVDHANPDPAGVRQLLEVQLRTLGSEHVDVLRTKTNLASVHQVGGRYEEAAAGYLDVLETSRRLHGEGHRSTLTPLFNLACNAALRGDRDVGLAYLRKAVDNGYARPDKMTSDEDLTALHGPEFNALVERATRNAAARGR